jgi:hypothetical protein
VGQFNLIGGSTVERIVVDAESGLKACQPLLVENRISMTVVPTQRHVKVAERVIQELKSYARSAVHSLPFALPGAMFYLLVQDVTLSRNCVVHKGHTKAPRELFSGKPIDLEDFRFAFGTIGQTRRMNKFANDLSPRTELGIIVGRYPLEHGIWMVWLARSSRIVKRKEFVAQKVTPAVLAEVKAALEHDPAIEFFDDETIDRTASSGVRQVHFEDEDFDPPPSNIDTMDETYDGLHSTEETPGAEESTGEAPEPPAPRRSERSNKGIPPERLIEALLASTESGNKSFAQAMIDEPVEALAACRKELGQMVDLDVFEATSGHVDVHVLLSKLFFKRKSDGSLKARLVIGGHLQRDVGETFSPTVNTEIVNLLLAIAGAKKARVIVVDVSGAFLHVPIRNDRVFMRLKGESAKILGELDKSFVCDQNGEIVVHLRKAIYGLAESSRDWNLHLTGTLTALGWKQARFDPCLFIRDEGLLCFHVDDVLVVDFANCSAPLVQGLKKAYGKATVQEG